MENPNFKYDLGSGDESAGGAVLKDVEMSELKLQGNGDGNLPVESNDAKDKKDESSADSDKADEDKGSTLPPVGVLQVVSTISLSFEIEKRMKLHEPTTSLAVSLFRWF